MSQTVLIRVGLLFLLFQCITRTTHVAATEYVVGDENGWGFDTNLKSWLKGKHFKAGDVLRFDFNRIGLPSSVLAVNESQYKSCYTNGYEKQSYTPLRNRAVLEKGTNYFICSIGQFCDEYGLKMAVNAT